MFIAPRQLAIKLRISICDLKAMAKCGDVSHVEGRFDLVAGTSFNDWTAAAQSKPFYFDSFV